MAHSHGVHLGWHLPSWHRGTKSESLPGDSTKLGGEVLLAAVILAVITWAVALSQIVAIPEAQQQSMQMALWTAVAIASGISMFLLIVWKAHRA